jgi:hypothetical protein
MAGGDAQIALIWHDWHSPLSEASVGMIHWTAGGSLVMAVEKHRLAAASQWIKTSPARRPRPPRVRFGIATSKTGSPGRLRRNGKFGRPGSRG